MVSTVAQTSIITNASHYLSNLKVKSIQQGRLVIGSELQLWLRLILSRFIRAKWKLLIPETEVLY